MCEKILKGPSPHYEITTTLGQFFFSSAERFKNRTCQIDPKTKRQESFASVKLRSIRVALAMQDRGITSEDVIVTCSASITFDTPIPILAAFYLGAKIANLDSRLSARQTSHLLGLVAPSMIFVEEDAVPLIEERLEGASFNSTIVVFGKSEKYTSFSDFEKLHKEEGEFKPTNIDIHKVAIIFFSSGTTGLPKAICHGSYSFLHIVFSNYYQMVRDGTFLLFTSFYWITGLLGLSTSFFGGSRRIIYGSTPEPKHILQMIEEYKVTYIFLPPLLGLQIANFESRTKHDTSSIYTIFTTGSPINVEQFRKLSKVFDHSSIIFAYGLSEAGIVANYNPKTDKIFIKNKPGSSGKPGVGMEIKVVDVTTRKPVGPNERGEICVKSPSLMVGYYKADSSEVFDEDNFLKTGDVGFYDNDECFYIVARLKEMFIYMNWQVVPSVIETVILEHPAVKEAVVFGVAADKEEEGEEPTACVVLKDGCDVSGSEIEEFVASRVSETDKLRGGVFLVDKLQKTPSGKVMRNAIRNFVLKKHFFHRSKGYLLGK